MQAARLGFRLLLDAEQTHRQPAIDNMALALMRRFNSHGNAVVYNTYQFYLDDARERLERDLRECQAGNATFAVKVCTPVGPRTTCRSSGDVSVLKVRKPRVRLSAELTWQRSAVGAVRLCRTCRHPRQRRTTLTMRPWPYSSGRCMVCVWKHASCDCDGKAWAIHGLPEAMPSHGLHLQHTRTASLLS